MGSDRIHAAFSLEECPQQSKTGTAPWGHHSWYSSTRQRLLLTYRKRWSDGKHRIRGPSASTPTLSRVGISIRDNPRQHRVVGSPSGRCSVSRSSSRNRFGNRSSNPNCRKQRAGLVFQDSWRLPRQDGVSQNGIMFPGCPAGCAAAEAVFGGVAGGGFIKH